METVLNVNVLSVPEDELEQRAHAILLRQVREINDYLVVKYSFDHGRMRDRNEAILYSGITDQFRYAFGERAAEALDALEKELEGVTETCPCTISREQVEEIVRIILGSGARMWAPQDRIVDALYTCLQNGKKIEFSASWRSTFMMESDVLYAEMSLTPSGQFDSSLVARFDTKDPLSVSKEIHDVGVTLAKIQPLLQRNNQ